MRRKIKMKNVIWMLTIFSIASATTMLPMSIEELTDRSSLIIKGTVASIDAYKNEETGVINSKVSIIPEEVLKGQLPSNAQVVVIVWGGTVGDLTMYVPGAPEFNEGERVLLFLNDFNGEKHVVGLAQGKFSIVETEEGVKAVRDIGDIYFVTKEGKEIDLRNSYYLNELINIIKGRKNQ